MRWVRLATPPLLAIALYWPALQLPFFWDDVGNFNFLAGKGLGEIWASAAGFAYYRPLGFSVWWLAQRISGAPHAVALHALNIFALAGCGWLVGALAMCWPGAAAPAGGHGGWVALVAAALLTASPFAALVVPLVASLFHLLVTLLALLGALALLEYRRTARNIWGVAAAMWIGLAPFAHESGVAVGLALLCLLGWQLPRAAAARSGLRWLQRADPALFAGITANALFPLLWLAVPKMRAENTLPLRPAGELLRNSIFFLQGLTYPLQLVVLPLKAWSGWDEKLLVSLVGGLALLLAGWLCARAGTLRAALAAAGFSAVAALPSILMLKELYVVVSPRLLVFPAVGAVLLWALALWALAQRMPWPRSAALALLALLLLTPVRYIWSRVQLHVRALAPIAQLVQVVRAAPHARQLLVNPVRWLALDKQVYPIVHDGVVVLPEYHSPADLIALNSGLAVQLDGVHFPLVDTVPPHHYYDVWGDVLIWGPMAERLRQYDGVWLMLYGDGPLKVIEAGQVLKAAPATVPLANFGGGKLRLMAAQAARTNSTLNLELVWQAQASSTAEIFVHGLDCTGNMLGQADGAPLARMFPLWLWRAGEAVRDVRQIHLANAPADGCTQIAVGLFDPASGARLPAADAAGLALADDRYVIKVP